MRAFEDIPNEILLQIVRDVQLSDQLSLSFTSWRLRSIAERHIYRSVTLEDPEFLGGRRRKLQKFLRTIISRPELGEITRHIDILWYGLYDHGLGTLRKEYPYDGDKSYLATMQTLAREKGLSALAVSELENGWCRPHFSLLMHLLPSLKSLLLRELVSDTKMETRWVWAQDEYHGPTPVGLRSLLDLDMGSNTDEECLEAEDVIPFMSLPTLNSFRVGRFGGQGKIRWDEDNKGPSGNPGGGSPAGAQEIFRSMRFVKRSSKLRKLVFYLTDVNSELLDGILQIPEALDTLICDGSPIADIVGAYHIYSDPAFRYIKPTALARALRHQMHSLTTLSVTTPVAPDLIIIIEGLEPMGSLSDFALLKTLRIPCLYLLGSPSAVRPQDCAKFFGLLPSSLVNLSIEMGGGWDGGTFLDAVGGENVSRWISMRGRKAPSLETVIAITLLPDEASHKLEALGIGAETIWV